MSFVYKDWSELSYKEVKEMIENDNNVFTVDYNQVASRSAYLFTVDFNMLIGYNLIMKIYGGLHIGFCNV